MMKKRILKARGLSMIALCTATALSLTACQKSPDSSIVVNKDLDKLIEQAETPDENQEESKTVLEKEYGTYKTTIEDEALRVKVNVDAQVDIPETDQMSVFRVSQQKFTQEFLDKVRKELVGDTVLYNGAALKQVTRKEQEFFIAAWKNEMEGFDKNSQGYKDAEKRLAEMEEAYESAPTEVSLENEESDGKLQSIPEKYNETPTDEFYSWLNELTSGEGETFYGVSDGSDGTYSQLYVLNSENRSNRLSFVKGNNGYQICTMYGFEPNIAQIDSETTPDTDEAKNLTKEEAVEIADAFLKKVGINDDRTDFRCYESEKKIEELRMKNMEETGFEYPATRRYYVLTYMRYIDGAFVTDGGTKYNRAEREGDGAYVKKDWPAEKIEFRIDDSGIVGFNYIAPLQFNETVVEKSAMQPYEQIQKTFEKMIVVTNGSEDWDTQIDVNRVTLGYAMVSEPNSYDTGLLVPVWDFWGSNNMAGKVGFTDPEQQRKMPLLTINAIDGSVIDRELGY